MSFTVTSTLSDGMGGSLLLIDPSTINSFPATIDEALTKELEPIARKAETTAKRVHKYRNKTGLLESSTHVKVSSVGKSKSIETRVEGYIDSQADYARHIINGTASRAADPFLGNALKGSGPEFDRAIDKALNIAADKLVKGK